MTEKPRLIIVSDSDTSQLISKIGNNLSDLFALLPPAQLSVSNVRSVAKLKPDLILVRPTLENSAGVDDLSGIVRRLRQNLPHTPLVAQVTSPPYLRDRVTGMFDSTLEESLAHEFLASTLMQVYLSLTG